MEINVMVAAQYAAPYEGNFIKSLRALEAHLAARWGCGCCYVFPEKARLQPWMADFAEGRRVFFTPDDVRSSASRRVMSQAVRDVKPCVIHTHFDGYDINAARVAPRDCHVVWHLHDWLSLMPNWLKATYQRLCFWRQFGLWAKNNVSVLSVCTAMIDFVAAYGFPRSRAEWLPNGIDLARITPPIHII